MPNSEGKEFYDYLASSGALDTSKYPAGEDNYKLALESPSNAATLEAWRQKKNTPPDPTGADIALEKQEPIGTPKIDKATPETMKPAEALLPEPAWPETAKAEVEPAKAEVPAAEGLKEAQKAKAEAVAKESAANKAAQNGAAQPQGLAANAYDPKKEPSFWDMALDGAMKTGKGLITFLADFATGYAGKTTPSELRAVREHDIAMEGKKHANNVELAEIQNKQAMQLAERQIAAEKEIAKIKQDFEAREAALSRSATEKMKQADQWIDKDKVALEKQRIQQDLALQMQTLEYQQQIALLNLKMTINSKAETHSFDEAIGGID
ncbi:MAG: hypothetical protein WC455_16030 [Dehalococcoidia bacterium]|jgi:hypothetical protein